MKKKHFIDRENKVKLCTRCNIIKPFELFSANNSKASGLCSHCKDCCAEKYKERYDPEERKKWYHENRDILLERLKVYQNNNKEKNKERRIKYIERITKDEINKKQRINGKIRRDKRAQELKDKTMTVEYDKSTHRICTNCGTLKLLKDYAPNYITKGKIRKTPRCLECASKIRKEVRLQNLEKVRERDRNYDKKPERQAVRRKYRNQPHVKLATRLRHAARRMVKQYRAQNIEQTLKYLGCSMEEFVKHIESQFTEGMNWEVFNTGVIHLDHIIPMCSRDLRKEEELKIVCHYTNIRPLWHSDNAAKSEADKRIKFTPPPEELEQYNKDMEKLFGNWRNVFLKDDPIQNTIPQQNNPQIIQNQV